MKNWTLYKFIDPLVLVAAFLAAYWIRVMGAGPIQELGFYALVVGSGILFSYFSFFLFYVYNREVAVFSLFYLENILKAWLLWGALLGIFAFFSKAEFSRAILVIFFLCYGMFIYSTRFFVEWYRASHFSFRYDPKISSDIKELVRVSKISSQSLSLLEGLPLRKNTSRFYDLSKRVLDFVLAGLALLVLWPLFVALTVWIRSDTPGGAIISQERMGRGGRKFLLYKFRTMHENTPLYAPAPRSDLDIRVTKAGRMLRKYSLDELPQLWNVLKGDMSIVGPRPEMPFIAEKYESWQRARLEVKPGITGLWQIFGRKDLPLEENLEYDFYYLYHRSFFLDLAIILKTIPHLLFPKGAY